MQTEAGKALAAERSRFLQQFLDQLKQETYSRT
jgi:HD superfamily phosphodiesterase